jgi:hypothetical protein
MPNSEDHATGDGALNGDSQAERDQRAQVAAESREAIRRDVNGPVEAEKSDNGNENDDRRQDGKQSGDEITHDRIGEEA